MQEHATSKFICCICGMLCCTLLLISTTAFTQDTLALQKDIYKRRITTIAVGGASIYGVTLVGLNETWYTESASGGFHFFNDYAQWQQVDKAGHFYTAYQVGNIGVKALKWSGMQGNKAILLGSLSGLIFQTPVEILDGFSADYGASWGDMAANAAGSLLALQNLLWDKARIHPKFSFHQTQFAGIRPNMLGNNLPHEIIKDYNGQTYWLAFDIYPWLNEKSKFPKWLNVAIGYGAENMVFAHAAANRLNGYDTYRQYYLSLDVNFTRIRTKNKAIRSLLFLLNTIHIPAPAIEFNRKKGIILHPVYF